MHTSLEFKQKRQELQITLEKSLGVERADEGVVRKSLALAEERKRIRDVREVTNAIADKVRYSALRRRLDQDIEFRTDPHRRVFTEEAAKASDENIEVLRAAVVSGETEPFQEAAMKEALMHGYRIAPEAQGIPVLAYGYVQALLQAALLMRFR